MAANFEWDEAKRATNLATHGIDFEGALTIWDGPDARAAIGSLRRGAIHDDWDGAGADHLGGMDTKERRTAYHLGQGSEAK